MYYAPKKTDGSRGEVTFQIKNKNLSNAGVTINFVKSDKNRCFVFLTKEQIKTAADQQLLAVRKD